MSKELNLLLLEIDRLTNRLESEISWYKNELRFSDGPDKEQLYQYKQALEYSLAEIKRIRKKFGASDDHT